MEMDFFFNISNIFRKSTIPTDTMKLDLKRWKDPEKVAPLRKDCSGH